MRILGPLGPLNELIKLTQKEGELAISVLALRLHQEKISALFCNTFYAGFRFLILQVRRNLACRKSKIEAKIDE